MHERLVRAVVLTALCLAGASEACGQDSSSVGSATPVEDAASAPPSPSNEDGAVGPAADAEALDAKAPDAAPPPPPFDYFDVNHVLSTGQSLSIGSVGTPPLTLTQPYSNVMFVTGVMAEATGLTSFVPLVEGDIPPGRIDPVETMSSSLANLVTKLAREQVFVSMPQAKQSHDVLVSVHGVGGTPYVGLKKGTAPYATGLAQATAGRDLAKALGKSYVVRAVTTVHGENDHVSGNTDYASDLIEWQSDYEEDVKALTGQTIDVPLFQTQVSSWTKQGQVTSLIPYAQLQAHIDRPGKIVLVGPKYHLPYAADGVHLTNEGYRHMGEDYAKAYRRVILEGLPWEPLRPKSATLAGKVITVTFHVPSPPLVFDTTLVTDPGNKGFEYIDDADVLPEIVSVALDGPDRVKITLSAEPTGNNREVHYAAGAPAGSPAGPTTGPRGNLRDSDTTPSRSGYPLFNWCVHFVQPVQ